MAERMSPAEAVKLNFGLEAFNLEGWLDDGHVADATAYTSLLEYARWAAWVQQTWDDK